MTIKSVSIYILIVCVSFICGVIALAAGKMIALCMGLVLGGASILAAALVIYAIAKEREQKRTQEKQEPAKSNRRKSNARK